MVSKDFYKDLAKIKDQYEYGSGGHGSINIYCDKSKDDNLIAVVNWSSAGDQTTKWARKFAEALLEAVEACEKFNATHTLTTKEAFRLY